MTKPITNKERSKRGHLHRPDICEQCKKKTRKLDMSWFKKQWICGQCLRDGGDYKTRGIRHEAEMFLATYRGGGLW